MKEFAFYDENTDQMIAELNAITANLDILYLSLNSSTFNSVDKHKINIAKTKIKKALSNVDSLLNA